MLKSSIKEGRIGTKQKAKGPWINRFATRLFTVILAILIYWFLGFIMSDIKHTEGPQYEAIEQRHVDPLLSENVREIVGKVEVIVWKIGNKRKEIQLIDENSKNIQQTINQLIELQKLSLQKNKAPANADQKKLTSSLSQFLENQQKYQNLNSEMSNLDAERLLLISEEQDLSKQLENQRKPARIEHTRLIRKHRLIQAFFQLLILLPLLFVGVYLIMKKRSSSFFPIFIAFGSAVLLKVTFVVHDYFPAKYFKYILILILIFVVIKLLIYFIKTATAPKAQWLNKQYREAYQRFLCPVCEYPIRTGQTVNKIVLPSEKNSTEVEAYTCPSCGTSLFKECSSCHKVRHSLLEFCTSCGAGEEEVD